MNKNQILEILKNLLRIRMTELKISVEYSKQKMRCPVHLSIGQEAIAAPLKVLLTKKDIVVSGHRAHAHYIGKGCNLEKFIFELYLKEKGFSRGKAGSMHLFDKKNGFYGSSPIVANSIPLGVGMGYYNKINKIDNVVLIFFGDGATEEGVFYESLNFAAIHNLRVLFICENNFYSVYSNLKFRQPHNRKISEISKSLGIYSIKENGNDIRITTKTLSKALNFIKKNSKPILIEYSTFRFVEHCGPNKDDHLKYRNQSELNYWMKNDPIKIMYKFINNKDKSLLHKFKRNFNNELNSIFLKAEKLKYPKESVAYTNLYNEKS